jgi:hypothetical protein
MRRAESGDTETRIGVVLYIALLLTLIVSVYQGVSSLSF